jgi:hypothetical protein
MPRGVYQRKSADAAAPAVKKATSKATSPAEQSSQPLAQDALVLTHTPEADVPLAPPISPVAVTPPDSAAPVAVPLDTSPIRGSVDDMAGDKLKRYAKQVGVMQRDIDGLSEDRLRQNCKAMIFAAMED